MEGIHGYLQYSHRLPVGLHVCLCTFADNCYNNCILFTANGKHIDSSKHSVCHKPLDTKKRLQPSGRIHQYKSYHRKSISTSPITETGPLIYSIATITASNSNNIDSLSKVVIKNRKVSMFSEDVA